MAIPKKIHYCWFGGNPLNKRTLRYIERWKELCPDFEFIRWDETNCDEKQLEAIDLILAATEPAVWQDCATEATIANAFMNGGQLLLTGDMTAEDVMASVQTAAAALK